MEENNRSQFYQILDHYWESRSLILAGMFLFYLLPWSLVTLFLLVDFIIVNPVIPLSTPITPQEAIKIFLSKVKAYGEHLRKKQIEQLNSKEKKLE